MQSYAEVIDVLTRPENMAKILAFARRLSGDFADDIVQDSYFRVLRHAKAGRVEHAESLISTAVRNRAYTFSRRLRRHVRLESICGFPDTHNDPVLNDELGAAIERAFDEVFDSRISIAREDLKDYLMREASAGDLAKKYGVSENAMKTRIYRCRKKLKEKLKDYV